MLGLVGVGVAAALGNYGIALLLVAIAPIPLTAGAVQAGRAAGSESLTLLGVLPLIEGQRRFFSGWFLFAGFMALGVIVGAVGIGLAALL
jgi:hypothetical protein